MWKIALMVAVAISLAPAFAVAHEPATGDVEEVTDTGSEQVELAEDATATLSWRRDVATIQAMLSPMVPVLAQPNDTTVMLAKRTAAQKVALARIVREWTGKSVEFGSTYVSDVASEVRLTAKGQHLAQLARRHHAHLAKAKTGRQFVAALTPALLLAFASSGCTDCTTPTGLFWADLKIHAPASIRNEPIGPDGELELGNLVELCDLGALETHAEEGIAAGCPSVGVHVHFVHRGADIQGQSRGTRMPAKGTIVAIDLGISGSSLPIRSIGEFFSITLTVK